MIEEFLDGPEVSVFVVTDGETVVPLLPAQDFKRLGDGDAGPNTGGMGAYAPLPWLPDGLVDDVVARVAQPTIDEMRARGTPFAGLLYIGLALTGRGCAGGRVQRPPRRPGRTGRARAAAQSPLARLLHDAATGRLAEHEELRWSTAAAVAVVLASEGYPEAPVVGREITGLGDASVGATRTCSTPAPGPRRRSSRPPAGACSAWSGWAPTSAARARPRTSGPAMSFDGMHLRRDIAEAAAALAPTARARARTIAATVVQPGARLVPLFT